MCDLGKESMGRCSEDLRRGCDLMQTEEEGSHRVLGALPSWRDRIRDLDLGSAFSLFSPVFSSFLFPVLTAPGEGLGRAESQPPVWSRERTPSTGRAA